MEKKRPVFICAQPCIIYYAWQVEVMLDNFTELGIHEKFDIHILIAYDDYVIELSKNANLFHKLAWKFRGVAQFFFYCDSRPQPIHYISSIRPNVLYQHFYANPELSQRVFFYHDCDIVFTKYPDFLESYCSNDDNNWYASDTISYIGHNYIKSKGQVVLDAMLSKFGISESFIQERESQSGGAQYVMKGVDWRFFQKVQVDCEVLFKDITMLNNELKKENPEYHELQIWCSDMWALLWNAWMRGYKTNVVPELDFAWATDNIRAWDEKYIFHNAGVTEETKNEMFFKSDFRSSLPYDIIEENYDNQRASFKYVEQIKKTASKTCLI